MDFDLRACGLHSARHLSARLHSEAESGINWRVLVQCEPSSKMTNYIEKESDSIHGQRPKLVAELMQLQQAIAREEQPSLSVVGGGVCRWRPPTRSPLYVLGEVEEENGEAEDYVDIGEEVFMTQKPYDPNSDEDNISVFYDSDGDDDARSYFPCPFCYVEIEVPVLCSHLQEEHCFDLKNAVCPLCAANLGKDATGHFIIHHSSSLKRRRKSEKPNSWSGNSAMLGKKLVPNVRGNRHEPMPDPLLSPFIFNGSVRNPNSIHQNELSSNNVSTISDAKSAGDEKDHEERKQKAAFVQQLAASTIFEEIWW